MSLTLWLAAALHAQAGEQATAPASQAGAAAQSHQIQAPSLAGLLSEDSDQQVAVIDMLALSDDPQAQRLLDGLADESLVTDHGQWWLQTAAGSTALFVTDAATPVSPQAQSVTINNLLRGSLANARALRVVSLAPGLPAPPARQARLEAAQTLASAGSDLSRRFLPRLRSLVASEHDAAIRAAVLNATAQQLLGSAQRSERLEGLKVLADSNSPTVLGWVTNLSSASEPDPLVRATASKVMSDIRLRLVLGQWLDRIFTGLSLGSILLLAALGLAITYGVMGVINMAHGEFLTLGAYCAYVAQSWTQHHAPAWAQADLLAAIPLAFFVCASVGWVLERAVFRHLYGRPLETLLASWGLSLMLIQAARMIFGPQNVQVANPDWLSGSVALTPSLVLPWNRIATLGFSMAVLTLTWLLMQRTRLGLYVRAVTQNREMASCVGVVTGRVDATAFALGAGIAGLGGVALSQIANVGPDMGQGYIVDSFMVVVLGGVGQLAGAVWAAFGLGIAAKLLEGWTGAVIAKIMVLAFVIIFIQRRPQGLFAQRGRQIDA